MSAELRKIAAEMKQVGKCVGECPVYADEEDIHEWASRIEAELEKREEPVFTLCLGCGESLTKLAKRRENGDMRPCCPDSKQEDVYAAPPDLASKIAALEAEVERLRVDAERLELILEKVNFYSIEREYLISLNGKGSAQAAGTFIADIDKAREVLNLTTDAGIYLCNEIKRRILDSQ